MSFGGQDRGSEVERFWRREKKVGVFEGLGKKEGVHAVFLLPGADVGERGEAGFAPRGANDGVEVAGAEIAIALIAGRAVKVKGGFEDFGAQLVPRGMNVQIRIIKRFGQQPAKSLDCRHQAPGACHITGEGKQPGEEGLQRAKARREALARVHVDDAVPVAVRDVPLDCGNRSFPHGMEIFVAEQAPGFV